ncbi:MAG TPA: hypothetical protein VFV14_11200, partial [Myxococcaceae bacterium]|nr:hypothetical protein [Myxococcaceae bacterium]
MPFFDCLQQASFFDCLAHPPLDPHAVSQGLWLIIALPLAGALLSGLLGRVLGRANTNLIACAAVGGSFVISLLAFLAVNDRTATLQTPFSEEPVRYAL